MMNIKDIIKKAGGVTKLARQLGIRHSSVLGWKQVPPKRVVDVECITGIPREVLRPDVFRTKKELNNQ